MLGARVGNAEAHRPILRHNHAVIELFIQHYPHQEEGHAGLQQVLSTVRERFWIVKNACVVKRILKSCNKCKATPG